MKPFETRRLRFRPLVDGDLARLHELHGDQAAVRYVTGRALSLEDTRNRLQQYLGDHAEHGFGLCAALLRKVKGKPMIGICGLQPVVTAAGLEAEGLWLFDPEHRGQGYATEFGFAMIPSAFAGKRLRRIFASCDRSNEPSIRMMQRIGMREAKEHGPEGVEFEILDP